MGYVFDFQDAMACEKALHDPYQQLFLNKSCQLMHDLLAPSPHDSILDIGCGIGTSLESLFDNHFDLTGIDPSVYMLDFANRRTGDRAQLDRGIAEELPYDDNSFNHALLVNALEFTEKPEKAIAEACRVAKDRLFIGVLNRYALMAIHRRCKGIFQKSIYNRAVFFSLWEITSMLKKVMGPIPITWRAMDLLPPAAGTICQKLDQFPLAQKVPFGSFIGIRAELRPRFKTRPLKLKVKTKKSPGTAAG
jgi:SAM-dependent methyltransferase